jgi:hypothetical protein
MRPVASGTPQSRPDCEKVTGRIPLESGDALAVFELVDRVGIARPRLPGV